MNIQRTLGLLTKTVLATSFSFVVVALLVNPVWAVGTAAGMPIANTATLNYSLNGTPVAPISDTVNFTVDEIVDVVVTWQDGANVPVVSPDTDRVLTFLVTNIGNGSEDFSLVIDNAIAGDQFDPNNARIYIDNGNGVFDGLGIEAQYFVGVNEPTLDANATDAVVIYVVNDIPAGFSSVLPDTGISNLTASSTTVGPPFPVATGTVFAGAGDGGVDAVVGPTQAQANANGIYEVQSFAVAIVKSNSIISDPTGCAIAPCSPIPGAVVRYTLVVNVSGIGIAENLTITDLIPAEMTYNPGTITHDAVAKSDIVDADEATFALNTVTVDLGNVTAIATHTITFDVTIN
jgi:uncharacterized repeat protein (TIGR01451 family)